jgi:CHAD domain-containing protein
MSARPRPSVEAAVEARRLVRAQVRVVDTRIAAWTERSDDRDALHAARTALRRLRVLVRSFKTDLGPLARTGVRRRLRGAFRASSSIRDLDVFTAWVVTLPPSRATLALAMASDIETRHRAAVVSRQMGALWRDARRRLRLERRATPAVRRAPRLFGAAAARAIRAEMQAVEIGLGRFDLTHSARELHQTRIAVKRLRYVIESLTGRSPDSGHVVGWCRAFQDLAGECRDATLAARRVNACPAVAGRDVVLTRLADRRRLARAALRRFVADTGAWRVARRDALALARRYALGSPRARSSALGVRR